MASSLFFYLFGNFSLPSEFFAVIHLFPTHDKYIHGGNKQIISNGPSLAITFSMSSCQCHPLLADGPYAGFKSHENASCPNSRNALVSTWLHSQPQRTLNFLVFACDSMFIYMGHIKNYTES